MEVEKNHQASEVSIVLIFPDVGCSTLIVTHTIYFAPSAVFTKVTARTQLMFEENTVTAFT